MNRLRRRRLLKRLRANVKALGHPQAETMSNDELEKLATRFGTLEQVVVLTDRSAAMALDFAASMRQTNDLLTREDVQRVTVEDVQRLVEPPKPAPGTHDEAGDLILLRGGPMDGYLVREGAPVLMGLWSNKGAYSRASPPDRNEDGTEVATWEPS